MGSSRLRETDGVPYVEFDYLQPTAGALEARDVGWVKDIDPASVLHGGHGTYWECCASIMVRGVPLASDENEAFGAREYHKTS